MAQWLRVLVYLPEEEVVSQHHILLNNWVQFQFQGICYPLASSITKHIHDVETSIHLGKTSIRVK